MEKISRLNAQNTISEILEKSDELYKLVSMREVDIVATYYNTTSGSVYFDPSVQDSNTHAEPLPEPEPLVN